MGDLASAINQKVIRRLAGDSYYQRGVAYFEEGRVGPMQKLPNGIVAAVRGTQTYKVRLEDDDGILDYDCNCPIGEEGFFCKHCVATGLAWLQAHGIAEASEPSGLTLAGAVDLILDQDRADVRRLLLRLAKANPWLENRLFQHGAGLESPEAAAPRMSSPVASKRSACRTFTSWLAKQPRLSRYGWRSCCSRGRCATSTTSSLKA